MGIIDCERHLIRRIHYHPDIQILFCAFDLLRTWQFNNLSAPFWRIYWNANEGGEIFFRNRRYEMKPDTIFLIAPNTPFKSNNRAPIQHFYLHFTTAEPFASIQEQIFVIRENPEMDRLVHEICRMLEEKDIQEGHEAIFAIRTLSLAHLALTLIPSKLVRPMRGDARIERILEYINLRLDRKIPNSELAALANMHVNAFTRLFKRITGHSPQSYINRKRIERACVMLHNINVSIEDVADALGFCDRYHFSRVFKQIRGIGPATFQKTLILGEKNGDYD